MSRSSSSTTRTESATKCIRSSRLLGSGIVTPIKVAAPEKGAAGGGQAVSGSGLQPLHTVNIVDNRGLMGELGAIWR